MIHNILVTQEDIDNGNTSTDGCPIARAVARHFGKHVNVVEQIILDNGESYNCDAKVINWWKAFDNAAAQHAHGNTLPLTQLKPFLFRLTPRQPNGLSGRAEYIGLVEVSVPMRIEDAPQLSSEEIKAIAYMDYSIKANWKATEAFFSNILKEKIINKS